MVNQYGAQALKHWQEYLPQRFAEINNPEMFFTELGEQAEEEILTRAETFAGDDPPGESYLEKAGRLREARLRAESEVVREMILLDPAQEQLSESERLDAAAQWLTDVENLMPPEQNGPEPSS
ncbi:TnpV protein [Nonomuraea typhae]|uniref:TnpV protein n=1 Tax=Nonomuraea typhae TaxID=2603600 RepID=UPI0015E21E2E|nr:TnpV protein [Nonomuraea typhae]